MSRARRTTRQLTQIYEHELEPAGVTINQFGEKLAQVLKEKRINVQGVGVITAAKIPN
jgi:hypothetical protein